MSISDKSYQLWSPAEMAQILAGKTRELRLRRGWKQPTLAGRSGVSLASLRRFEQTGQISLKGLLRIAFALGRLGEFTSILHAPEAHSIAELEEQALQPKPKRGRK